MTAQVHLSATYYLPRSMGGDVQQPNCVRPFRGWAGDEYAAWPMTENPAGVDCPRCLGLMPGRSSRRPDATAPQPVMAAIVQAVAKRHGVTCADLRTPTHRKLLTPPRQEAMSLCYDADFSNAQVASHFGLLDHTTVIHARRRHAERRAQQQVAA